MQKQRVWKSLHMLALSVLVSFGALGTAVAFEDSSSTNYSVTEVQFGSGAELDSCSDQYCAKQSLGDTAVGSASSASYSADFGFNTSDVPYIDVVVTGGDHALGVLNVATTAKASNVVSVRSYLSAGYVIQITGETPSQGTHALDGILTPSTSNSGVEQFGINMVSNTNPVIGAAPVQVPDASFSFGQAATDYSTADLFKYVDGDIVARSLTSSGQTDYTLSMIVNISNVTPGGRYEGALSAVVVPVY